MYLPNELIELILEYDNPYKTYFTNNIISYFRNKNIYNILMKQLKQYCIYDINGNVINFQIDSILNTL